MEKIHNIKGYWDATYTNSFNETNMWEGQIILEEDGWFEGIVRDPNSGYTQDRFVCGVYHPSKVIELYKFAPSSVSSPFVFHGKKEKNGYNGEFEIIGLLGPTPYGVCNINTEEITENLELQTAELKSRIQTYKDNMEYETSEFYTNSIAMRNSLIQIILRNYEGKTFTEEEAKRIMDECLPVNERIIKATEEEARQLVLTFPETLFDDEDFLF